MLRASEKKAQVRSQLNGVEGVISQCGDSGWELNLNCSYPLLRGGACVDGENIPGSFFILGKVTYIC